MMATLLELAGHAVVTAANGAQALSAATTHHPALILLDLMMPVMTGEEFRTAQLLQEAIRDIPVVVVSAHHQAREIGNRMNAADCLGKPVDMDHLLTVCASMIPN